MKSFHADLEANEPTMFLFGQAGDQEVLREVRLGPLIVEGETNILKFDWCEEDCDAEDRLTRMCLEPGDGMYHWRASAGRAGHWWGVLAASATHYILSGNMLASNGWTGVFFAVWPEETVGKNVSATAPKAVTKNKAKKPTSTAKPKQKR